MGSRRQPALDWKMQTEPEYTRTVEVLVQHEYGSLGKVRPVDGRGGDAGVDIRVDLPDGEVLIFQLKHYLEGFSGKHKDRRRHIKDSFVRALTHDPTQWVLVVPCTLTPPDWSYVAKLKDEHDVPITVWHRARLDQLLCKFPRVVHLLQRDDHLIEQAVVMGKEQAVLAGGGADLAQRVAKLGEVADAVDDDWTFDFARQGDTVIQTLRALHSRAADRSPITITMHAVVDEVDSALRRKMERSLDFGLGGFTLPVGTVKDLTVDGPPLVRQGPRSDVEVRWIQAPNPLMRGKPVEVRLEDETGTQIGVHHGQAIDGRSGARGLSLQARFHDAVTLTWLMPMPDAGAARQGTPRSGTLERDYAAQGPQMADECERAAQMTLDLARARRMVLLVDGQEMAIMKFTKAREWAEGAEGLGGLERTRELAHDLDMVQRVGRNRFPMPASVTGLEEVQLRAARLMLDGHCVMHPYRRTANVTLTIPASPEVKDLLTQEAHAVFFQAPNANLTVAGHELYLPVTHFWHPQMRLRDRDAVRARLNQGEDVGAVLESVDGTTFRTCMPERVRDPERMYTLVPWGILGVEERAPLR